MSQVKAVKALVELDIVKGLFAGCCDWDREVIDFDIVQKRDQSGGQSAMVSWIHAIWTDQSPPADEGFGDPFGSLSSLDSEHQESIFKALAIRHGWNDLTATRTIGPIEIALRNMSGEQS